MAKKESVKKNGAVVKYLTVTNHMRAPWILPMQIMRGFVLADLSDREKRAVRKASQTMCFPNESVEVEKTSFDIYYKASRAFQYLVDTKRLVVTKKAKTIIEPLLKTPEIPAVPVELTHDIDQVLVTEKSQATIGNLLSSKITANPLNL